MLTRYDNYNFHFSMGGYDFHISNIVLERFERVIPKHSHSKNSYEIHYIPYGNGIATINNSSYEIILFTIFTTLSNRVPYVQQDSGCGREPLLHRVPIQLSMGRP